MSRLPIDWSDLTEDINEEHGRDFIDDKDMLSKLHTELGTIAKMKDFLDLGAGTIQRRMQYHKIPISKNHYKKHVELEKAIDNMTKEDLGKETYASLTKRFNASRDTVYHHLKKKGKTEWIKKMVNRRNSVYV